MKNLNLILHKMDILKNFRLSKYVFHLDALESLHLPSYKGSTLRGAFGDVFRRVCCFDQRQDCQRCTLATKCAYSYIFETRPGEDSEFLRNLTDIPRPFIIEPPFEEKLEYVPGEKLTFNLILVGKAIDYLPYFIVAFRELGRIGLGKGRGKILLRHIHQADRKGDIKVIYSSEDEMVRNLGWTITFQDVLERASTLPGDKVTIHFLTPTRIKFSDSYTDRLEFHILVRRLLNRLSALSYFHCSEKMDLDYPGLISLAQEVEVKESSLHWQDWERYSRRQDTRMKLGGVLGKITYDGDLRPFLPFLVLGEEVHVGKGCVFGLGKYSLNF